MPQLALFQPDIPQNCGAMIRLCAGLGAPLHVIEPCGFVWNEKKMRRSMMDYYDLADITRHTSWESFQEWLGENNGRLLALTTKSTQSIYQFEFQESDILLMGRESAGLPEDVHQGCDHRLTIPQKSGRSLNVALSAAISLSEACRQTGAL